MEKKNREIEEFLKVSGEQEEIPKGLRPENMKKLLEENTNSKKKKNFSKWYSIAAAAACLVLILFVGKNAGVIQGISKEEIKPSDQEKEQSADKKLEKVQESEEVAAEEYDTSYDDLYQFFRKREQERNQLINNVYGEAQKEMEETDGAAENAVQEEAGQQSPQADSQKKDYADTNKQEKGVDEGDIIKNDGRYLYQIISTNNGYSQAIQITDTKGGIKEVARIKGFDNVFAMYIWQDTLVAVESAWTESEETKAEKAESKKTESGSEKFKSNAIIEDMACCDIIGGNPYQKIYIYDIKDRAHPKEQHVFTVGGNYLDTRLTDGYFYCFVTHGVNRIQGREWYEDYIPVLEGEVMKPSSIYLPKGAEASNYFVMVSIDLRNPKEIKDKRAVVSTAERVYVTESNIYVADSVSDEPIEEEGIYCDKTNLIRFSYKDGMMKKEAEGSVKGRLLDDMAMNEYDGYLRMAVTVESYQKEKIVDEVFGRKMGFRTTEHKKDNSLYVLNSELKVVGKIEGLAEDEQIYSARFMGESGYFVTFRQVDPLFSVDLSNPREPKILGELKISGFSEYLHFYKDNLLLGIGMEADEDTGRTQGMKLSMFDISDPAQVTEQDKYALSEYDYSEGLYNYKAVMIDTEKNLFGFYAEGWEPKVEENREEYLLFSYEDGAFRQKMKIACDRDKNGICVSVRGTYIGDVFYLMYGDGRMEAYSLENNELIGSIPL